MDWLFVRNVQIVQTELKINTFKHVFGKVKIKRFSPFLFLKIFRDTF